MLPVHHSNAVGKVPCLLKVISYLLPFPLSTWYLQSDIEGIKMVLIFLATKNYTKFS